MSFSPAPYRRRAYYYETDRMSIVHHSNYIRWLEEARLDFMRQAGLDYSEMEDKGFIMPVTFVSCKYSVSLRFDEEFSIYARLTRFNGVRAEYDYAVYAPGGKKPAATAASGHCFLDAESRTPVNMKKKYPEFYEECSKLVTPGEREGADK